MTGPEHYREAERLLDAATEAMADALSGKPDSLDLDEALQMQRDAAQVAGVHAALALAAAQASQVLIKQTHYSVKTLEWARALGLDG